MKEYWEMTGILYTGVKLMPYRNFKDGVFKTFRKVKRAYWAFFK